MDYGKKDAVRVSKVLGFAALFSMLLGLLLLLAERPFPVSIPMMIWILVYTVTR